MQSLFSEGEADKIADQNTAAAGNMAGLANTQNVNKANVDALTADRQRAPTSEGSVQVAASMVLNIQSNDTEARISDGVIIEAEGAVLVNSKNDTDGIITANSSATNSTTGVGVGVAINIVSYENISYVGASHISGSSLTVKAEIVESDSKYNLEKLLEKLMKQILEVLTVKTFVNKLIAAAKKNQADYAVDVYPYYGSDVEATLRSGVDIRHGLIGAGVYASHGYERSHMDGVYNTLKVLAGYLDV